MNSTFYCSIIRRAEQLAKTVNPQHMKVALAWMFQAQKIMEKESGAMGEAFFEAFTEPLQQRVMEMQA